MSIRFGCPSCYEWLSAPPKMAGKGMPCPGCQALVRVPRPLPAVKGTPAIVEWFCPTCEQPFRLIDALHGRRIRCRGCEKTYFVSSHPWALVGPRRSGGALPARRGRMLHPSSISVALSRDLLGAAAGVGDAPGEVAVTAPPAATPATPNPAAAVPYDPTRVIWSRMGRQSSFSNRAALGRGLLKAAAGLAGVLLASLVIWLFWPSGIVETRYKYLPDEFGLFSSLDVRRLTADPLFKEGSERLLKPPRLDMFENFLGGAGLRLADVARITFAGDPAGQQGGVVVYELQRELNDGEFFRRGSLAKHVRSRTGSGSYVRVEFDGFAVQLVDPRLMLVGRSQLLDKVLGRWRPRIAAEMRPWIASADAQKPSVAVCRGLPPGELEAYVNSAELRAKIVCTVDEIDAGSGLEYSRTLHFPDPAAAAQLTQALAAGLKRESAAAKNRELQALLEAVKVEQADNAVRLHLTLAKRPSNDRVLAALEPLF